MGDQFGGLETKIGKVAGEVLGPLGVIKDPEVLLEEVLDDPHRQGGPEANPWGQDIPGTPRKGERRAGSMPPSEAASVFPWVA